MSIRFDIDWDDLRFFLVAAQSGTATAAANALKVSRTTVTRRVESLERSLGLPLYETTFFGAGSTDVGRIVLNCARDLESRIEELKKELQSSASTLHTIRISLPAELDIDIFDIYALEKPPGCETTLEFVQSSMPDVELRERRSLISICIADDLPAHLHGKCVATLTQRPYVQKDLATADLHEALWIGFGKELMHSSAARWVRSNISDKQIAIRVNSAADMKEALKRGLGIGYLWDQEADPDIFHPTEALGPIIQSNIWVCMHEDVPPTPIVRQTMEALGRYIQNRYGF